VLVGRRLGPEPGETGDPAATGSPRGVEPLRLGGDDAEILARCRVPTRSGEWSFDDADAGAAPPSSNCADHVIGAIRIAAKHARPWREFDASAQLGDGTAGPRKDEQIIGTPNVLAAPAAAPAWGITVPWCS